PLLRNSWKEVLSPNKVLFQLSSMCFLVHSIRLHRSTKKEHFDIHAQPNASRLLSLFQCFSTSSAENMGFFEYIGRLLEKRLLFFMRPFSPLCFISPAFRDYGI